MSSKLSKEKSLFFRVIKAMYNSFWILTAILPITIIINNPKYLEDALIDIIFFFPVWIFCCPFFKWPIEIRIYLICGTIIICMLLAIIGPYL